MCYCFDKDKHNGSEEKPYYFNEGLAGACLIPPPRSFAISAWGS